MKSTRAFSPLLLPVFLFSFSEISFAASPPDAGQLLREKSPEPIMEPSGAVDFKPPSVSPVKSDKSMGPTLLVNGFRFVGVTLVSDSELQEQVSHLKGKELNFFDLRSVANIVTQYYLDKGYIVRVVLPEQKVKDGIIEYKVIEGKRGQIQLQNDGARIQDERARGFINHRIKEGDFLATNEIGQALNILNDQPGVEASISIKPGMKEGEADLVLSTKETPLMDSAFYLNNHGSKSTGSVQGTASIGFNNPFGLFDAASLMVNVSEGSKFVRGEYSLPIGFSGLRAGVNVSSMRYDVIDGDFTALDSHGDATTAGVTASYPLKRLKSESWILFGNYNYKTLHDYTVVGETGDAVVDSFAVGISGFTRDGFMGGGQNVYGLSLTTGKADLSGNDGALAADLAGRHTHGSYSKISYKYARQQILADKLQLAFNLNGQFANENLHSSEGFSLGGINGVRAYPMGEASGDEGILASANFIYSVNDQWKITPFIDFGHIRINKDNSVLKNPTNSYELYGTGVAFNFKANDTITVDAVAAFPVGSNPGEDANGNDSDGENKNARAYLNITARF